MKSFLLKICLFFAIVVVMDLAFGKVFDLLRSKAQGGRTYKNEYVFNHCKDDILVLGSSRASHHYVPSVIEDSLGLTCYNAGEEGCGIIPAYVRYRLVADRKKPKLVIYEITPGYDYLTDHGGYSSYLGAIRQYADRKEVRDMYLDFSDEFEPVRLLSRMYRNNSCVIKNIKDIVRPTPNNKGYDPLLGVINPQGKGKANSQNNLISMDSLKLSYIERLIKETRSDGVALAFFISPFFNEQDDLVDYEPITALSGKYGIPIINNADNKQFVGVAEFFQDYTHLNNDGAVAYTQYIIPQISDLLNTVKQYRE